MGITLDMSTLSFGAGVVAFFSCLPMFFFLLSRKAYPGMVRWIAGTICNSVGLILISFRGQIPDLISIVIANLLLAAFAVVVTEGLLEFVGRRQLLVFDLAVTVCCAVFFYAFSIRWPSYTARVVAFCSVYAFYALRSLWIVWRYFPSIRLRRNWLLLFTFTAAAAWYVFRAALALVYAGSPAGVLSALSIQRATFLLAFGAIILVISGFVIANIQRLLQDLNRAEREVTALSGLLPICANCRRIRDDNGRWIHIELYLTRHSDASFSHGLCDECASKLHPDLFHGSG